MVMFDLYNTLIVDNHKEEQGQYCINTIWSIIEKAGFPTRFADVIKAYNETLVIMKQHQEEHFSLSVFELVNIFGKKINLTDIALLKKFYDVVASASLQYPPSLIPHVKEGLETLKSNGKKIALVSNTAVTPGITLRFLLKEQGIYDLFDDMVFSDEFGFMKPEKMIFERVLQHLKMDAKNSYFVGDHEFYDKLGATSVGIEYIYMSPDTDFREVVEQILK